VTERRVRTMQASDSQSMPSASPDESRYRALFEALREPVVVTSGDGRVLRFNAAARGLFGALNGQSIQSLLPFLPELTDPPFRDTSWQGQLVDPAGQRLDVEVSLAVLDVNLARDGELAFVLHDVSDHVERSRLREQLLENIAHELKGPVSILENLLEIVAADYAHMTAEAFGAAMSQARRTSGQLRILLEDLLSVGIIQAGQFTVNPRPTALAEIVSAAVQQVGYLVEQRNQQIEVAVGPELTVVADAALARQVLVNLLTNASKYSPDETVVRVSAEPVVRAVRVEVADQGSGIAAEHRAMLFDRFYRAPTGSSEPGAGLGLAIAKGIVEAHGGRIDFHSEPGAGTRVWFTLPIVEPPRADTAGR
jgi:two-component system phosphate regulon sensor histidine kinase PhoR